MHLSPKPRRRRKRFRPNWPYLAAWLAIVAVTLLFILGRSFTAHYRSTGHGIDWQLSLVASCIDAVVGAWFVASGAAIGSFINVVAYRLPRGRSILGPSRCPYCHTSLSALDNMPILGWLRLRGRCSTCRLPIAARYIGVELWMSTVFTVIFFTDYIGNGWQLPRPPDHSTVSFEAKLLETPFGIQILLYLWVIAGLVGGSLIALDGQSSRLKLWFWTALPCFLVPLVVPGVVQVPWRIHEFTSPIEQRLDALITALCGLAAGVIVARLIAPNLYGSIDHKLIRQDRSTLAAQQLIGTLAAAGALLGWQSMVYIGLLTGMISLTASWLSRHRTYGVRVANWSAWVWLAVLVYRSSWSSWRALETFLTPHIGNIAYVQTTAAIALLALSVVAKVNRDRAG